MDMNSPTVSSRLDSPVATLALERPPLNILNLSMVKELAGLLDALERNEQVKVVALVSGIEGVFSAGADVREHLPGSAKVLIESFVHLCKTLVAFPKPLVALVDGKCLGGGMEVALSCDIVLSTTRSTFGQPEVAVGVFPPIAAALYPGMTGLKNTSSLLLTGATIDATEAHRMGLVNRVVEVNERDKALQEMLSSLSGKSGVVLRMTKKAMFESIGRTWEEALDRSARVYLEELMKSEDAIEGLNAFIEKRKPNWKDR